MKALFLNDMVFYFFEVHAFLNIARSALYSCSAIFTVFRLIALVTSDCHLSCYQYCRPIIQYYSRLQNKMYCFIDLICFKFLYIYLKFYIRLYILENVNAS